MAGLAFLAIGVAWLLVDGRIPDADSGKHLLNVFAVYDGLAGGHPTHPLIYESGYPPLVYVVGAAGVAIGGLNVESAILAENLFFVPLLVGGCYAAGCLAYDRRAGLLAALFALGAPIVISLFHVMMLDGPLAALVAVTVALLMASRRFERLGVSLAAGCAFGLGMLTKQTFPLFLAGFLLVFLGRGAWRNWRGLLLFGGAALVLSAPWYLEHLSDVATKTEGATQSTPPPWYDNVPYPERWTVENFTWYGWSLLNNSLYLPLALAFVTGLVLSVRRAFRRLERRWEPELLAGAAVSYAAISMLQLDDPRYLLPWLVYVAVIATGWIAALRAPWRTVVAVALVAVVVLNTAVQNLGLGSTERISLWDPSPSPIAERTLTVLSPSGYVVGSTSEDGEDLRRVLEAAHSEGARRIGLDFASITAAGYHPNGFEVTARLAGLRLAGTDATVALGPRDVYLNLSPAQGEPPCGGVTGHAVTLTRGGPPGPERKPYCPVGGRRDLR